VVRINLRRQRRARQSAARVCAQSPPRDVPRTLRVDMCHARLSLHGSCQAAWNARTELRPQNDAFVWQFAGRI